MMNYSPELLDTLQELYAAISNDASFATTVGTHLGNKLDKVTPFNGQVSGDYANVIVRSHCHNH
jgi:hypothetical protein